MISYLRRLLAVPCLTCLALPAPLAHAQTARPNILVIWGDDIGWQNVSAYGMGTMGYSTPNIDSIGMQGIRFTDRYAQPSCTAGRAAFITGQYPIRSGMTTVGQPGDKLGLQAYAKHSRPRAAACSSMTMTLPRCSSLSRSRAWKTTPSSGTPPTTVRVAAGAVPFLELLGIVAGGWQIARSALVESLWTNPQPQHQQPFSYPFGGAHHSRQLALLMPITNRWPPRRQVLCERPR